MGSKRSLSNKQIAKKAGCLLWLAVLLLVVLGSATIWA